MKKLNLLLAILFVSSQLSAQVVRAHESALVYYMPKTQLAITLSYERTEQQPGIFFQYAQRYLGANEIITEKSVEYQLTDLSMNIHTIADTTRAHKVPAHKYRNLHLLSLSEDGRLLGYNLPATTITPAETIEKECNITLETVNAILPLLEEQFMAGSIAKMAEGAAKLIYRIRDTRLHLLAGDVEHVPADGQAMQIVLDELNKQEQELIELFVGTTRTEKLTHTIYYTPAADIQNEVIGRFSKHVGFVDKNNLSGEPIYLNLVAYKQLLHEPIQKKKNNALPAHIYYNLPGSADISIQFKNKTITQHIAVAQYGSAMPLANTLFSGKPEFSILINPETGNIISIQK